MANVFVLFYGNINDHRNMLRIQRRALRNSTDPFHIPESRFIELFRFNKSGAMDLLNELSSHMKNGIRKTYIPKHLRMCAALHYYATGSFLRDCGEDFICPISKTMICRIVHDITCIIQDKLMKKYITFPSTQEEQMRIKRRFYEATGFPGVIGAIDCTHMKIKKPTLNVEHCYINRKRFHSKNVQLICDLDLQIFNCLARYGGSSHDAYIWSVSKAKAFPEHQYENDEDNEVFLIGDSGYPLQPWLMTPVSNPATVSQQKYNDAHCTARNCVERLNGVLKKVFACLSADRGLLVNPAFAGSIINACCTLHNIRKKYNLPMPADTEIDMNEENDEEIALQTSYLSRGRAIQERIVRNYFSD